MIKALYIDEDYTQKDFISKINEISSAVNWLKDSGTEPYIPSVHLKNTAPLEWLESKEGKDFIDKLREFENQAITPTN